MLRMINYPGANWELIGSAFNWLQETAGFHSQLDKHCLHNLRNKDQTPGWPWVAAFQSIFSINGVPSHVSKSSALEKRSLPFLSACVCVCVYVSSYYTLKIMYILTHNNILHINEFYIYQKIFWFFYKLVLEKFQFIATTENC